MSDHEDTPSIIGREITSFRGQRLWYRDLTGPEKRDYLFDAGIRPTAYTSGDQGMLDVHHGIAQFAGSALSSTAHHLLAESLTRVSDELETPKPKLFHTYGTAAKVAFAPSTETPYTGLFRHQLHGLARFSYAGPVVGVGIVPGLGLKFPLDGDHPSQNLVVMHTLDPQSRHSVFEHVFTNILPTPRFTNAVMRAVKARVETVVIEGRGLHQHVESLAAVDPSSAGVGGAVRAPYRVLLVPTEAARRASDPGLDFREDLARNIPSGTAIYEVLALDEAEEAALRPGGAPELYDLVPLAQRIGTITTESEFIASRYGDYRLFFQHSDVFLRKELRRADTRPG